MQPALSITSQNLNMRNPSTMHWDRENLARNGLYGTAEKLPGNLFPE